MKSTRSCAYAWVLVALAAAAPRPARAETPLYGPAELRARLDNAEIRESSGLAASRANAGLYWTHNDSGNAPVIYAFDDRGTDVARYTVDGARNVDWEDMAAFTLDGTHYLAIADTGDRPDIPGGPPAARPSCAIHFVREPRVDRARRDPGAHVPLAQTITFHYENGPRDCEAMAVDASRRAVYLMSKALAFRCEVYRLELALGATTRTRQTARVVARAPVPVATSLDISADGKRAVALTYLGIAHFTVPQEGAWKDTFSRKPVWISIPRAPMAEGIAFGHDDRSLLFTCEITADARDGAPLYLLGPAKPVASP